MIIVKEYYDGANICCHKMKNDMTYIKMAAQSMAKNNISKDDILVPAPSHNGKSTYTLLLAKEIAKLTNATVWDHLYCIPHEPMYSQKKRKGTGTIKMYSNATVPNKQLYFVDNCLASGSTFLEAKKTLGKDLLPLVYAIDSSCYHEIPLDIFAINNIMWAAFSKEE